MLIEETTTYAYKLKYLENPSFDKVKKLASKYIDELPKELVDDLYNAINRGVDFLKTEPEMLVYLYSFGNMHQAKLNKAFENIPHLFFEEPEINIIDYGCGQAIGTMCYADFIKSKKYNQKIQSVTLIEPSKKCLRRAALHTSVFIPDAEIITVNKTFDELAEEDINCDEDVPTLHILSNVLDLLSFDLENFADLVKGRLQGYNQFVCVGPYFGYEKKDFRMDDFVINVGGIISYSETFGKGQFVEGKNWTCQAVVTSVGELEEDLSTEVTEEDIENGVEDEFGMVYSKDGYRLLGSKYAECRLPDIYYIKEGTKVIGNYAFDNEVFLYQNGLTVNKVVIPNTIMKIGDYAFGCCYHLQVEIPQSIKSMGKNPFVNSNLISFNSNSSRFVVENDLLIDNQSQQIISYIGQSPCVDVPNTVTSIGDSAFSRCIEIRLVTIPNSVKSIGDEAFSYCHSLEQITIPESVVSIGKGAFYNSALQKVNINNPKLIIGDYAFCSGCKPSFQFVIIPKGSEEHFKPMLPKYLWKNLYHLNKVLNIKDRSEEV